MKKIDFQVISVIDKGIRYRNNLPQKHIVNECKHFTDYDDASDYAISLVEKHGVELIVCYIQKYQHYMLYAIRRNGALELCQDDFYTFEEMSNAFVELKKSADVYDVKLYSKLYE